MPTARRPLLCALALAAATLLAALPPAEAADTEPAASAAPAPAQDKLAPARALIRQERWRDAIAALQQAGDSGSADWNNLMGYSHRKAKVPDYAAAERHYNEALRIDPRHRGALEYSGELYLALGDLARAEARLAALEAQCPSGCAEREQLRGPIAAFKATGNKVVARP
jgi:tetratricopeptide (TPR) repeat protein